VGNLHSYLCFIRDCQSLYLGPLNLTASSSSSLMVLRLALLVCDTPVPAVIESHGKYPEIYDTWLKASDVDTVRYKLTPFDVVNHPETYPNPEEFDAVILTGSGSLFSSDS
jgi:hypothetical protein